jgi:hypothetical protein
MARAISASERPLRGAGTMVTSPSGSGDFTRKVMRWAVPMTISRSNRAPRQRIIPVPGSIAPAEPGAKPSPGAPFVPRGARYFNGWPMATRSVPTRSISHSILSPATVAATPDGVPVMMMSPAASSTISDSLEMISGTFQII